MSNWEISELNGWTPFAEAIPPFHKDVLVWAPWRDGDISVRHLLQREGTRAGDGCKVISYSWYPGGFGTEDTYWMEKPKTPTLKK